MSLQHVALGLVQPCNHHQFVSHLHPEQCFGKPRFNLEPGVRRAFRSLPRRVVPALHGRSNETNGLENVRIHSATFSTFSMTQLCVDDNAYPNSNVVTPKISASGICGIGPSTIRAQPKTSLIRKRATSISASRLFSGTSRKIGSPGTREATATRSVSATSPFAAKRGPIL